MTPGVERIALQALARLRASFDDVPAVVADDDQAGLAALQAAGVEVLRLSAWARMMLSEPTGRDDGRSG